MDTMKKIEQAFATLELVKSNGIIDSGVKDDLVTAWLELCQGMGVCLDDYDPIYFQYYEMGWHQGRKLRNTVD